MTNAEGMSKIKKAFRLVGRAVFRSPLPFHKVRRARSAAAYLSG
jgi:hypothetical protein